jgi:glycosyltransferase involved in cell wall biosynthesis
VTNRAPLVSVLLPVRDGAATIGRALASVLSQSFEDFELLVLDDGSRDRTAEEVARYPDPRVRWISDGRQRGLAWRLNQGIDLAQGRYLARMDADDICHPDRLRRQLDYLRVHPEVDLAGCQAVVFRDNGSLVGLFPVAADHAAICARPWIGFYLPHPTWLGKAEWFRRHRYAWPEVRRAEDQELLLRSHAESRFACLDEMLLAYRQGGFDLRKTLLARRSLLAAQLRQFSRHRQWTYTALALLATLAKVAADLAAAVPGCDGLFFRRLGRGGEVPEATQAWLRSWDIGETNRTPACKTSSST